MCENVHCISATLTVSWICSHNHISTKPNSKFTTSLLHSCQCSNLIEFICPGFNLWRSKEATGKTFSFSLFDSLATHPLHSPFNSSGISGLVHALAELWKAQLNACKQHSYWQKKPLSHCHGYSFQQMLKGRSTSRAQWKRLSLSSSVENIEICQKNKTKKSFNKTKVSSRSQELPQPCFCSTTVKCSVRWRYGEGDDYSRVLEHEFN